ncbi:MAG: succinate CoA transferase [Deltaproteobacteria bacterium]|jgi:acetyl-CoA hydrolase|nr:succinate CoA transferase [Deltaproteobacteria bacterium]
MSKAKAFPLLSPEEAAEKIFHGATVAFSGFTNAGAAKLLPRAIAARAESLHSKGEPFKIRVLTGASSGESIDEPLARAQAMSYRAPYQSGPILRRQINQQEVEYVDMHLSHLPQTVLEGFHGKVDFAVIEATEITSDGRVYLTTSIGASPTYLKYADHVIIEINRHHSERLREMADIVIMPPPPHRFPLPFSDPLTKVGYPYAVVDPKKVVAVLENDEQDHVPSFSAADERSHRIAQHVVRFLLDEMLAGRIPDDFPPLQAGVGNVSNGVMAALAQNPYIPPFRMYTEVFQDSLVDIMEQGKLVAASTTSLTVTHETLKRLYSNMDFFVPRIVLRPQEISNHPGIIRRLGVIALNTAIEVDIYGNVNSSHVYGMDIMNGIGGSGEFTRNSYISIFMCPSVAKGGRISAIVPMCPHIDNNEHSVQIVVTDQGLADLRGMGPAHRAQTIIERCAHPAYKDYLHGYLERSRRGHIRHDLATSFELHLNLMEQGAMLPDLDLSSINDA